jgi:adenylylsulfate kinase-like enzyme
VASAKPVEKATTLKRPAPKIKPLKKAKPESVKLKVLSGTGKLFSAQKMTKTLYDMGYKAEKMDMAPRSNFTQDTVYYSKGHKDAAENIKKNLGSDTVIKPLSWNSVFDVIVVAGP